MFPGFTAYQLFEQCPPEEAARQPSKVSSQQVESVSQLLGTLDDRLQAPDPASANWGDHGATWPASPATTAGFSVPEVLRAADDGAASDEARAVGRRLIELQKVRRLSDDELHELANLAGNVVELAETVDIEIDADGSATVSYSLDLLNLTDRPLARLPRDIWFHSVDKDLLVIDTTAASERRVAIERIHDPSHMSKFALRISPPIQPGESALIGYFCKGGRFDAKHYWRQAFPRFTRHLTMRVRQTGVRLNGCTAVEELPDGSQVSAADTLIWDYEGEEATMMLTRDHLRPSAHVSLHWEVSREAS
ncbi:hypothetical protein ACWDWO_26840 [Actinopolymorpha singaporensis]